MAAVDALSLPPSTGPGDALRWVVGGAVALAVHGVILLYLNRAPEPVGFETQIPVEMELTPPPAGEARMQDPGAVPSVEAEAAQQTNEPEMLDEITDEEIPPPPPETDVVAAEPPPPDEVETLPEAAAVENQVDLVETPPDVRAAVVLPPEATVVAQEVPVETPKPPPVVKRDQPKPEPKPVVRREEPQPKPQPTPQELERRKELAEQREQARKAAAAKAAKDAERAKVTTRASNAGGSGGASASAGASRSAAAAYRQRVQAAVAAQKRTSLNLSGRSIVAFTVTRSGAVTSVSASGPGPAAAEAAAMVRRAAIPPMPAEMTGGSVRYTLPVNFTPKR